MDEFEATRRLLPEPDEDPEARERARSRLNRLIDEEVPKRVDQKRRRRRIAVIAAVALTGLIGAAVIPLTRESAVARDLTELRRVLFRTTIPPLRGGRALRTEADASTLKRSVDLSTGNAYSLSVRTRSVTWVLADGSSMVRETIVSRRFLTTADRVAWQGAGSPALPRPGTTTLTRNGRDQGLVYDPSAISTDPGTLLEALRSGKIMQTSDRGDPQVFETIAFLLSYAPLSVQQRAALLTVTGDLEGIEALGTITDPLGRRGLAFTIPNSPLRTVLIFDVHTARLIAEEAFDDSDRLTGWEAYGSSRIVPAPR